MFTSFLSAYLRRLRRFPFTWWLVVFGVAITAGLVVSTSVNKATAAAAKYDGVTRCLRRQTRSCSWRCHQCGRCCARVETACFYSRFSGNEVTDRSNRRRAHS